MLLLLNVLVSSFPKILEVRKLKKKKNQQF